MQTEMRITSVEKLDDCFDGSRVYSYHFDQPWTRLAILQLASLGKLDYFADFPRPFFRLRRAGGLLLKGVEGLPHCRVVVPPNQQEQFKQDLEERLAIAQDCQARTHA
jgi:hypothetical protein